MLAKAGYRTGRAGKYHVAPEEVYPFETVLPGNSRSPVEMANNMKEYGSFIPGIRPGRKTAEYLEEIMNRITLVGASFLAAITIFPTVLMHLMDLDPYLASFLGGTGILIVVGVALDIVQKVESHLLMRHYEGFIKRGKIKGRRG